MSNGFFFAYASELGARSSRPEWFVQDSETEEWRLTGQRVLVSTAGVWITRPSGHWDVEPDPETGEGGVWVQDSEGVLSEPYVILSPEDDGSPAKRIEPEGHGGFA